MSDFSAVFNRYVIILNTIPSYPRYITTPDLIQTLENKGIYLTHRSIQRDLSERLSLYFPILCDNTKRPYQWSLDSGYQLNLPMSCKCPNSVSKHIYSRKTAA